MSEFINLDVNFADHIKFVRLVNRLGRGSEILPIRLWCYCGKYHKESGRLAGYSPQEIETLVLKWWGKPGEAIQAMLDLVFLIKEGKDYIAHDWKIMNGHIEAFHERAKKAAAARWDKLRGDATSNANGNAQALPEQCPTDLPTVLPTEQPNHKNKRAPAPVLEVKIPEDLIPNEPDIREWLAYKREKGQKYKPRGLAALWAMLRAIPPGNRKGAIDHSMGNNWAGIYEKNGGMNASPQAPKRLPAPAAADSGYVPTKKPIIG